MVKTAGFLALSEKEEKVLRMKQGKSLDPEAPLEKKTNDPVLLAQLLELEQAILARAKKTRVKCP